MEKKWKKKWKKGKIRLETHNTRWRKMEKTLVKTVTIKSVFSFFFLSILGCCLITLSSLVKIPFYPVSFTLQTLAIFTLGLTQSPKLAFGSAICYLFSATIGLPVLCGVSNPLWMVGKSGGYLVAFPIAAYIISKISQKYPPFLAVLCGQFVIYLLGFIWLIPFFGVSIAWKSGVLFFIPGGLLKGGIAIGIAILWKKWRKQWTPS